LLDAAYPYAVDFRRPIEAIVPGAQGRVLAVLSETTAELNLRTIAELSGVSQAQASRVLPRLVELGVVERREVPPSSQFRLVPDHIASRFILGLARSADSVLREIGRMAGDLPIPPVSAVVFGSFARGDAGVDSDIDLVVVRPKGVGEDDERWASSIERWRADIRRLTGNPVEVLELDRHEAASRLASRGQVWADIRSEGHLVHGMTLDALQSEDNA
jgi:predicted nucleotidyltransferase